MATPRTFPLVALASALLFSAILPAQQAATAARIVNPIDKSQLVTLKGNVNPQATAKNDQGRVSDSLPMAGLTLVLSRTAEKQAAFDAYVQSEYESGSPNYHHWLTPTQIGQQFGPAQSDIAAISAWLTSKGFNVAPASPDGMTISFSGTAGQVTNAFHTEIHHLQVNGKPHIANMSDPQIPAELATVVFGIKGLHNFLPHPLHRVGGKVSFNPDAHGWVRQQNSARAAFVAGGLRKPSSVPAANSASSPKPGFYSTNGYLGVEEDVAPADFAKIYNLPPGWPSTSTANGSGQTITVIGTSDICVSSSSLGCTSNDVANFKSSFGLPAGTAPVIAHGPDGDPGNCGNNAAGDVCNDGDLEENSLDVEWSGAVAPGAQIVLVTDAYNSLSTPTNDPIFDGAQWAITNAFVSGSAVYGSRIVSVSYGECELYDGTATNVAYNNLWQTAAAEGISVFVATGDSGSPACDEGYDGYGNPYAAQYGLTVSGLASTPYDTAVGGTDFSWCNPTLIQSGSNAGNVQGCAASNATTYWNTSNNSTTQASAKGYVPETPWNDTCESPIQGAFLNSIALYLGGGTFSTPEESCNFIYNNVEALYQDYVDYGSDPLVEYVDTVGGSGGSSSCVVNSSTSTTVGTCSATADSTGSSYGNLTLVNDGWPSPSWQKGSGVTGTSSLTQRAIPDVSFFAGDGGLDSATLICVSNDGAACTSISETDTGNIGGAEEVGGTSVATPEMAGVMALINQSATAAQGLANPELYELAGKQTYSECSGSGGTPSSNCYFNDVDKGNIAMACVAAANTVEGGLVYGGGGWQVGNQYNGTISPNCNIVNSGDTLGTLTGYSAEVGYDMASGLGSLNVGNVISAWKSDAGTDTATMMLTTTPAASSGTIKVSTGVSLVIAATVTGSNGTPTGSISVSGGGYTTSQTLATGAATITIPAGSLAPGNDTVTVTYGGDSTYASTTQTLTVDAVNTGLTAIVTASASPSTGIDTGQSLTLNIAVSPQTTGPIPTGSVTATSTEAAGGSTLASGITASLSNGAVSIPLPANSLSAGADTIAVVYNGDTTYAATTPTSVNVTVTASTYSLAAAAASPASVSQGGTATSAVTGVASTTGYVGAVSVSGCSITTAPSNAVNLPSCTASGTITYPGGDSTQDVPTYSTPAPTATVTTYANTAMNNGNPANPFKGLNGAGGAALAFLLFLGIPARRKSFRLLLGAVVLLAGLGTLSACGGSVTPTQSNATTPGSYTFTVTGTGNDPASTQESATFTLTVN